MGPFPLRRNYSEPPIVDPPMVDPPNKGNNSNNRSLLASEEREEPPLYKGQNGWSQCVLH